MSDENENLDNAENVNNSFPDNNNNENDSQAKPQQGNTELENQQDGAYASIKKTLSSLTNLQNAKKQHKSLNKQIHIYSHKILYDDIFPKKFGELPIIKNKNLNRSISRDKRDEYNKKPKFSIDDSRLKMQKMKENILRNKEERIKEGKETKEANRLMRENILIYKNNLAEENKQKKRIVDAKHKILKNSINNYKLLKKEYIDSMLIDELKNEEKVMSAKQNELEFLKMTHLKKTSPITKKSVSMNSHSSGDMKTISKRLGQLYAKNNKGEKNNSGKVFVTDINMK